MTSPLRSKLTIVTGLGARGRRQQRQQGGLNPQKDTRHSSACPLRIPSPNQVSSRHMQSCATPPFVLNPAHAHYFFPGPRVRRYRRRHSRCALHESTRPAKGQVPSIDSRTRGRYRAWYMARTLRYTGQRGMARVISRFRPKYRGEREQLGTLLSLVRLHCPSHLRYSGSEHMNLQLQSAQAARD